MENWRDIPGYEDRYMISDQGRVRSLCRTDIMRQTLDRDGYAQVTLTATNSRQTVWKVHKLVLRAFVGPKPSGLVTRHGNGVRADNRLSNLTYGTPKDNTADRLLHGTDQFGERNPKARLTADQVRYIRSLPYKRGLYGQLAEQYGVSRVQISYIVKNKSWAHLN